jgi:hypothetical protein
LNSLKEYSNCDEPVAIAELGVPAPHWREREPIDFLRERLLWIMTENQGVCLWAVRLDGTNDPPVVVDVDSTPRIAWRPFASSFSEFIYCQICDHPKNKLQCGAQEVGLGEVDLVRLQREFEPGPTTFGWPGDTNSRFSTPDGRILICDREKDGAADWLLFADDEEQIERLIRCVWNCGRLASTLYGVDSAAERIVKRVRAER